MAPRSTWTATTANNLAKVVTLDDEQRTNDKGKKRIDCRPNSYFANGKEMIAGSMDNVARRWDLQTGREVGDARVVCEQEIRAVAVSRDSRWIITGGGDWHRDNGAELKAWDVETGNIMKTFEGHSRPITCIDVSVDNKLLASGSFDDTVRIWDFNTGKLVAGPFESADNVAGTVRFSQNSKKLAVKSGLYGRCLEVWDIQEQKLDRRLGEDNSGGTFPDSPVFWTTKDRSIIAAFSLEGDFEGPTKIYEFNSSTLETVGAPFEGRISRITGLALSFDCTLLASASENDNTIKLWAFESRQLLASFDVDRPYTLLLSPNSRQLAYTTYNRWSIHICNIPPDLLARIWPEQATRSTIAPEHFHHADPLNIHPTRHPATVHRIPVSWSPAPRPLRSSHPEHPPFIRQLRKLFPSYFSRGQITPVQNDEPRDPLDFPATSRLLPIESAQAATQLRPTAAQSISPPPSATTRTRLRHLSSWWPIRGYHLPPPVVGVPLAQGKLRNAAAGAPKGNDGCIPDEDFDSRPPSPNSDSQRASAAAQTDTGEHKSSRLCFCL